LEFMVQRDNIQITNLNVVYLSLWQKPWRKVKRSLWFVMLGVGYSKTSIKCIPEGVREISYWYLRVRIRRNSSLWNHILHMYMHVYF
jgi:hypothetical protein